MQAHPILTTQLYSEPLFTLPYTLSLSMPGILRSVVCGDNWVAVGNNNGTINTIDMRMGALLHHWRPNDYALTQVCTCT